MMLPAMAQVTQKPQGSPECGFMKALEDPDALLLHQVHPVKLAADAGAAAVSFWLLWRGRTKSGIAVHYLIPLVASAFVLTRDVSYLRATGRGRYVLEHMPPPAQGVRALGDTLMVRGARKHQTRWIVAGALGVAAGWAYGLVPRPNRSSSSPF
jgi:hypothetical protein